MEATLPSDAADILSARTTSTGYMAVADGEKKSAMDSVGLFLKAGEQTETGDRTR